MKFSLYLIVLFNVFSINSSFLKAYTHGLKMFPMEKPHEIALTEDQNIMGKSKIIFTQDPSSYFYILQTCPLPENIKEDFEYNITSSSFTVTTKVLYFS